MRTTLKGPVRPEIERSSQAVALARIGKRERLAWVTACLLLSLIATYAVLYRRPAPEAHVVQFEVTLGENMSSPPPSPSISPDGQYVAIEAKEGDGPFRIWLHSITSLTSRALPGTEAGFAPFWSPDSRHIGFSTAWGLKRISLAGGASETICNLPAAGRGAWSRDGLIVFTPDNNNQPLFNVSAKGGDPKALTRLDPSRQETAHLRPQFLPDGRHFLYLATGRHPATYMGSFDSPEVRRVYEGNTNVLYAPPGFLVFRRGPGLLAQRFDLRRAEVYGDPMLLEASVASLAGDWQGMPSISENGVLAYVPGSVAERMQLVWFDRTGKRLRAVGESAAYSNPAISPDQNKVAVGKTDPQTLTPDIWVINFEPGTSTRLTSDPADDLNPAWSPDGARIAFSSNRKGHRDIYMKPATSVGEEQLLVQSAEDKNVDDWSADGQYLAYDTNSAVEWLHSFKEHKSMPLLHGQSIVVQVRFFPNRGGTPRWIAYTSFDTGEPQVYVRSFSGAMSGSGGKWQISTNGGSEPHWLSDGKELFYLNGNKLMAVDVDGDGESFRAGIPKELFETPLPVPRRNRYDVISDGKRFLMNSPLVEPKVAKFVVVENWPVLLEH
jgi:Tol biopolymer transport system component